MGRSASLARTPSCWPLAAPTRGCSRCRPRATASQLAVGSRQSAVSDCLLPTAYCLLHFVDRDVALLKDYLAELGQLVWVELLIRRLLGAPGVDIVHAILPQQLARLVEIPGVIDRRDIGPARGDLRVGLRVAAAPVP